MSVFLKKISLFFAIVLSVFGIWGLLVGNAISGKKKVVNSNTVCIGDSRMQYLYNSPDNYGITAEPVIYSFYKLKYIMSRQRIDTVFLAFSHNSISSHYDTFISRYDVVERYYFFLPYDMRLHYFTDINMAKLFYNQTKELLSTGTVVPGSFAMPPAGKLFDTADCRKRLNEQFRGRTIGQVNLAYLDSIKNICAAQGAELILVNSPTHPWYHSRVPQIFREKYAAITASYQVLDLQGLLTNDEDFLPDGDHVSIAGSALLSRYIDSFRSRAQVH